MKKQKLKNLKGFQIYCSLYTTVSNSRPSGQNQPTKAIYVAIDTSEGNMN